MFQIDEYVEKIHYLPLEISRHLHMIQELDRRAMKAKTCMEQLQQDLKQSLNIFPPPPQSKKGTVNYSGEQKIIIEKLDKAQTEYYHLSEEKCKITEQIFTEIEQQQEELHNETKRFCGENGLQNPTIAGGQNAIPQVQTESSPLTKKIKKNEEKRSNKIRNAVEKLDGIGGSPSKAGSMREPNHQASSLNSSNYEGSSVFGGSHQLHHGFDHTENHIASKSSKRQTKSKYASNRSVMCCNKDTGDLVICDKCSNCYHLSCIGEEQNDDTWFCKKCRESSSVQGEHQGGISSKAQHKSHVAAHQYKHSKITHH